MKRKIQLTTVVILLIVSLTYLTGCYPSDTVSYQDLDLVTTVYDTSMDFQTLKTFKMPDSIVHIKDTVDPDNNVDISRDYDDFILDLVKTNLINFGYVEEIDPDNNPPDVILLVSAMASKNYYAYTYYPYYWGWYGGWGWYWPYYKYYYPWYPGYPWGPTYIYSYTTGTLIMHMTDPKHATGDDDKKVPIIWLGAINGLLGSSSPNMENRLEYNINQAFDQSQYLNLN